MLPHGVFVFDFERGRTKRVFTLVSMKKVNISVRGNQKFEISCSDKAFFETSPV